MHGIPFARRILQIYSGFVTAGFLDDDAYAIRPGSASDRRLKCVSGDVQEGPKSLFLLLLIVNTGACSGVLFRNSRGGHSGKEGIFFLYPCSILSRSRHVANWWEPQPFPWHIYYQLALTLLCALRWPCLWTCLLMLWLTNCCNDPSGKGARFLSTTSLPLCTSSMQHEENDSRKSCNFLDVSSSVSIVPKSCSVWESGSSFGESLLEESLVKICDTFSLLSRFFSVSSSHNVDFSTFSFNTLLSSFFLI